MDKTTGWIYSVKGKKLIDKEDPLSVWVKVSWCQMTLSASKQSRGRKWVVTQVIDENRPKSKYKRKQAARYLHVEVEGGCTWVPQSSIPIEVASRMDKDGKASSKKLRNIGQRKYVIRNANFIRLVY